MEKLIDLANRNYSMVPLYLKKAQNTFCSWNEIPVLRKNEFAEAKEDALTFAGMPLLYHGQLFHFRTSGSAGAYADIYWKKEDYARSLMPLWLYRMKYYGIRPDYKMCYFYTDYVNEEEQSSRLYKNQLGFCKKGLTKERIIEIYEMMREYEPRWLILQPSMAVLLCECAAEYHLLSIESVAYVEFTGEILDASVRRRTEELFHCRTANQYGANEVNSIAYECPCGNMHILESNVYVEIIKDEKVVENEAGEICVTSLTNTVMPLIRYMIGDVGKLKRVRCACGNTAPVLEQLYGRDCRWIIDEKHNKITPYVFVRVFDTINKIFDEIIIQYQVIQKTYTDFVIKLFLEEDEYPLQIIEREIVRRLNDELAFECRFAFEYVDMFIEKPDGAKHSFFVELQSELASECSI